MIPAQAATQNTRRPAMCRSYSGLRARALAQHEGDQPDERDDGQRQGQSSLVRHRREVDGEDQRPDEGDGEDAPEVVDALGRLVDVGRDEEPGHEHGDDGQRQRDEEDRAPPEVLEQEPGDQRPERGDAAADGRPECDRSRAARARPERGDQRQRRGVGHAGREPAQDPREEEHGVRRRVRGEQAGRDRQHHPEHEQELAPVPVADRAQVEDGRGQPERVAHGDEVECGLGGVERAPDRGQRDVRDGQVEVRHGGDRDQRHEHQTGAFRRLGRRCARRRDADRPLGCVGHALISSRG